ncbi:hypothetical protein [Cerasicoccus maritimus]|uniref:hypothetical protein n=1 Tax=Cerasicoccus maritimus TaxID=490089 RepID=UPI002852CE36|nr:hypothetical protein [Cerasicoccus maritimus]
MLLRFISIAGLGLLAATTTLGAKSTYENWTSSSGTSLEGRFIGKTESSSTSETYWIVDRKGALYPLSAQQFSPESLTRAKTLSQAKASLPEPHDYNGIVSEMDDAESRRVAGIIAASFFKVASYSDTRVRDFMELLTNEIHEQFPDQPTILYEIVDPEYESRDINVSVRGMHGDLVLEFMLGSVELTYWLDNGRLMVGSHQDRDKALK